MKYIPQYSRQELIAKIKHWSPSQINILGCKFKWACRYLYKAPSFRKMGQNLAIGIYLHDKAKQASVEGKDKAFNRSEMIQYMLENIEESKTLSKEVYPEIVDMYLATYAKYDFNNENTEIPVAGAFPNMKLKCNGFVDHIHTRDDGSKVILDLKIKGSINKSGDKLLYTESEYLQLGTYSYFANIRDTELNILQINRRKKYGKVMFHKVPFHFRDKDYHKVIELVRLGLHEMFSGIYPPNRLFAYCNSFMCEYWNHCHETWGPKDLIIGPSKNDNGIV